MSFGGDALALTLRALEQLRDVRGPLLGVPYRLHRHLTDGQVIKIGPDVYPGGMVLIGVRPHPWAVAETRRLVEQHLGDVCAWARCSTGPRTAVEVLVSLGMDPDRAARDVAKARGYYIPTKEA